jgi:hypothetical protein
MSADGETLYYARTNDIAVMDVNAGIVTRTIVPSPYSVALGLAIGADGRRLYLARSVLPGEGALCRCAIRVVSHDAATGVMEAAFNPPESLVFPLPLRYDAEHQQVTIALVNVFPFRAFGGFALHPDTLAVIAELSSEFDTGSFTGPLGDPHRDRSYVLTTIIPRIPGSCIENRIYALRASDLRVIAQASLGRTEDFFNGIYCGSLAAAFAPTAPLHVGAAVSNRTVTLTWSPPRAGVASEYQLEAGSMPGASNLAVVRIGAGTSLVFPGVPPGVYYVRLRGVNVVGVGPASNEIRITVP